MVWIWGNVRMKGKSFVCDECLEMKYGERYETLDKEGGCKIVFFYFF